MVMNIPISRAAAAAFLLAAPASAQDIAPLQGEWTGEVTETVEGETTRYRMHVAIDADHGGLPVATVAYSLECRGVWTGASRRGRAWHSRQRAAQGGLRQLGGKRTLTHFALAHRLC